MVRLFRIVVATFLVFPLVLLAACGGSSGVKTTVFPVPASITLTPGDTTSMDLGTSQTFAGSPRNGKGTLINEPVSYQSNNTAVLTIAANGNACAGTWDNLINPRICTPGPVGVAQVIATTKGVSSPPTTVYVHQHIDKIIVAPIQGQIPPPPAPPITLPPNLCTDPIPAVSGCFSKNQTFNYQAAACNQTAPGQFTDITDTVGTFTWQVQNLSVAELSVATVTSAVNQLLPGQVQVTAKTPGITSFFAQVGDVVGLPLDFTTCPVQSIQLQVNGTSENTISVNKGTAVSLNPIVIDSRGIPITGVPLNWCSSRPANVSTGSNNCATNTGLSVSVSTPLAGGGTVIASCTPPNCNIGLPPPLAPNTHNPSTMPIYPENVVRFIVNPTNSTPQNATVYVSSTGCGTDIGCFSTIIPVTSPANTLGTAIKLPATPNSLVFDPQGSNAYLGTDFSFFNSQGLMKVSFSSGTPVGEFKSVTGKVLTISPDGKKVIVSDTKANPNQVFVVDTGSSTYVTLPIAGATAADFSPDALKAYIVAGSTLYVYSTVDPLLAIPLHSPANDVSFLANGAFAYVAGGNASPGVSAWTTCTDTQAVSPPTTTTPVFLKTLADASGILAVDPPNIDIISVTSAPVGCPPPAPINPPVTSFSLAQGTFVPSQLIASPDGNRIYLLTNRFGSVLVFDIDSLTPSSIGLTGSPLPIQASLTTDGTLLYVAANDGTVHVLDTQGGGDLLQITFPTNPETLLAGLCTGVTFPLQSVLNISAATQNGANNTTTYAYTVTSGPGLEVGATVVVTGMSDAGNNGVFVITALGSGTFTVVNASGVGASNQNGTGSVNIACNPDLIAVKP